MEVLGAGSQGDPTTRTCGREDLGVDMERECPRQRWGAGVMCPCSWGWGVCYEVKVRGEVGCGQRGRERPVSMMGG